ncbi:MAG: TIGR01777 family oxidoreductase [Chlamydiota bacterium]
MTSKQFSFQSELPVSVQEAFSWHMNNGALERLIPPWIHAQPLFPPGRPDEEGSQVGIQVKRGLVHFHWLLEHAQYVKDQEFTDIQLKGPFRSYSHCHRFLPLTASTSVLRDEITYETPYFAKKVARELSRYCSWKHAIIRQDLECYARYPKTPLRILVSGSSGFIGGGLVYFLRALGMDVTRLVRRKTAQCTDAICWDAESGTFQREDFEGFDAVIHLSGANIAEKRWSEKQKQKLFQSRCRDTWVLSQALSRLDQLPKTIICASAVGFYGDRGEEILTEQSPQGSGFLADLCSKWDQSLQAVEARGVRVVHTRFGQVLGSSGGVLKKMLPLYRMGLGGKLGSGKQWISWMGIDDLYGALYHILRTESLRGAVNCVAPQSLRQGEFAALLARKVHRPMCGHLPAGLLKWVMGEMAEELLLASAKVQPAKLMESGYAFRCPDFASVLEYVY